MCACVAVCDSLSMGLSLSDLMAGYLLTFYKCCACDYDTKCNYGPTSLQAATRYTLTSTLIAFIVNREANDDNDRFLRIINLLAS